MKLFGCESCGQVAFFENGSCVRCGHGLGFDAEEGVFRTLERREEPPEEDEEVGVLNAPALHFRRCANFLLADCNWLVPLRDDRRYCVSCRLNRTIPNLSNEEGKARWKKIEVAKRRLAYTALALRLPLDPKSEDRPDGLIFDILEPSDDQPVITGHSQGVITLNVAEADDPFREQVRVNLGEPYRTLLGHLRHEVGHHYWDRLVAPDQTNLATFRKLFGDERQSYDEALQRHYDVGAPPDWNERFVSAYASMHPWEDWAETWAHYLHMVDTMETARAYGLRLSPRPNAPAAVDARPLKLKPRPFGNFDELLSDWYPLTFALNSLNRSMGHQDLYPFVLPDLALKKLRFVHDVVAERSDRT